MVYHFNLPGISPNFYLMKKKLLLVFVIGLALLIGCLLIANKGMLLPLIILFPSYLATADMDGTLAGILGTAQFPVYYYLSTLAKNKKQRMYIIGAIILVHLLVMKYVTGY
jgi:hypothetical protein